jgi:hypothetical protein
VVATKDSVLGAYQAVSPEKVKALGAEDQAAIKDLSAMASKGALATTAVFPALMLAGYIGLFVVFRRRGGYRAVAIENRPDPNPRKI